MSRDPWRCTDIVEVPYVVGLQLMILVFAAGALLAVVGFIVGPIIRLALSRRRESLANASSVELTRKLHWLDPCAPHTADQ
jgi:Zn-dependent protease with chaperone function